MVNSERYVGTPGATAIRHSLMQLTSKLEKKEIQKSLNWKKKQPKTILLF